MFQPNEEEAKGRNKAAGLGLMPNLIFSSSSAVLPFSASAVSLSRAAASGASASFEEVKGDLEILERLKRRASQGEANAQFNLGLCYLKRNNIQHEWYLKFLRTELMEEIPLTWFYQKEAGVVENSAEALPWLQKAAAQGHIKAKDLLGEYYEGISDAPKAFICYHKAAEQGYAVAQFNLGNSYYFGDGIAKSRSTAVGWYRKAAEQGLAAAQFNLALCYAGGIGIPRNERSAVEWYQKAARQGYALAQGDNNTLALEHFLEPQRRRASLP